MIGRQGSDVLLEVELIKAALVLVMDQNVVPNKLHEHAAAYLQHLFLAWAQGHHVPIKPGPGESDPR